MNQKLMMALVTLGVATVGVSLAGCDSVPLMPHMGMQPAPTASYRSEGPDCWDVPNHIACNPHYIPNGD